MNHPARLTIAAAAILTVGTTASHLTTTQLDWSTGHTHTLTDDTTTYLHQLDQPVTLEIFYAADQPGRADVIDLTRRFVSANSHITITINDPDGPRALQLRVASGAVAATTTTGTPAVTRNPDEADLLTIIGTATNHPTPTVTPHQPPSQPLFPTPLGRTLLWLIPLPHTPTTLAIGGSTVLITRRRRSR